VRAGKVQQEVASDTAKLANQLAAVAQKQLDRMEKHSANIRNQSQVRCCCALHSSHIMVMADILVLLSLQHKALSAQARNMSAVLTLDIKKVAEQLKYLQELARVAARLNRGKHGIIASPLPVWYTANSSP